MKKLALVIFSMALFGLMAGSIGQETFKFGIIDSNRVLLNYQRAIAADKELKAGEQKLKENLDKIAIDIKTKQEKKTKTELFVEEAETADLEKEIEDLKLQHQQMFERGRQALLERNQELMGPIFKELEELIIKVGKEENYDLIIDRQAVLYFNEKHDITDNLIKLINAGAEKTEPKKEDTKKPKTSTENAK